MVAYWEIWGSCLHIPWHDEHRWDDPLGSSSARPMSSEPQVVRVAAPLAHRPARQASGWKPEPDAPVPAASPGRPKRRPSGGGRFPLPAPSGGGDARSRGRGSAAPGARPWPAGAVPPFHRSPMPDRRRHGSRRPWGSADSRTGRKTRHHGNRRSSPRRANWPFRECRPPARRRPEAPDRSGPPASRCRSAHSPRRWPGRRPQGRPPPARPVPRSPPARDPRSRSAGRRAQAGRARRSRRAERTPALRAATPCPASAGRR